MTDDFSGCGRHSIVGEVPCPLCASVNVDSAVSSGRRFEQAVDVLLNSAVMAEWVDDFWAVVDGELPAEEFRRKLG